MRFCRQSAGYLEHAWEIVVLFLRAYVYMFNYPRRFLAGGVVVLAMSLAGCVQTVESTQAPTARSSAALQECTTSNDAEFARLVRELESQIDRYDSIGGATFSKCGWVEITRSMGIIYRANFTDLRGDINSTYGRPVYLQASRYAYRLAGQRGFTTEPSPTRVGYITTANLSESQRAVDRLNATLTRLARVANGGTITAYSGAEQAAGVERTQGRLRAAGAVAGAVAGQLATAAANAPAERPAAPQVNTARQCSAERAQCYALCEGLSRENRHALVVSSPYSNCRRECARASNGC